VKNKIFLQRKEKKKPVPTLTKKGKKDLEHLSQREGKEKQNAFFAIICKRRGKGKNRVANRVREKKKSLRRKRCQYALGRVSFLPEKRKEGFLNIWEWVASLKGC